MDTTANNIFTEQHKFTPASGTTDQGHEYEEKVAAFILLKVYQSMDNCWISSNMDGMKPLDDVIICTKELGKNVVYLCQIKHSQKSSRSPGTELNEPKSDLSMHIFYKKFHILQNEKDKKLLDSPDKKLLSIKDKINRDIPDNYRPVDIFILVIFTNRTILEKDFMFNRVQGQVEDKIFNTIGGEVYRLNSQRFSNNDTEFCDFINSVYVYANQGHASNIEENIQSCMEDILKVSIGKKALTNYMKYIKNWIQITEAKIGIKYKLIRNLIEFSFLRSIALKFEISQNVNDKITGDYLWEDIESKSLFITKSHLPFVMEMISNKLHYFMNKKWQSSISEIGNILFEHYNYDKLQSKQKYMLFCFLGKSPFVIDNDQFPNLTKFQFKYVPIGEDNNSKNLAQINEETLSELLKKEVAISCGRNIVLRDMLKDARKIVENLSISDALSLINVEDTGHNIKNEILFDRKIKPTFLKIEALYISNVSNNDLFVINISNFNKKRVITILNLNEGDACCENNYEDKFKYAFVTNESHFYNFTKIVKKNVHFIKIIDNCPNFVKWIGTYGNVDNIIYFREDLSKNVNYNEIVDYNLINLEDIHNYFQQSLLILSGVPGIGKSTAMKQITLSAPKNIWVLHVNLVDEQSYFKNESEILRDSKIYLNHFYKNQNTFLRELFNIKIKNKEVLILFDAFDEIAPTFTETVSKIIKHIRAEGFKIILTTRTVLEKQIERSFRAFSISLCSFNQIEQEEYLKKYLAFHQKNDVNIRELLDQIDSQNSLKFCSIPLHINLVGNMLLNDKSGNINLLNIYEQYVNDKIRIFEEKYKTIISNRKLIESYHKDFAIKTVFCHTKYYESLSKYIDRALTIFNEALNNGDEKFGLLISNDNDVFVHRTIAEFYVAKWLAGITNDNILLQDEKEFAIQILNHEILKNEFDTLRLFFNLLINQDFYLHEAILTKNFTYANEIIQNNIEEISTKNYYNQTLLHTLISSCNVEETSYNLNKDLVKILNLLYNHCPGILQEKDFCNSTVVDYANIRVPNLSLEIHLVKINIEGEEMNFITYSKPFNLIEFVLAKFPHNNTILDILSIIPKAKEINFNSLTLLAESGFTEVRELLKMPHGINAVGDNGNLLHWAVENNNIFFIYELLSHYENFSKLYFTRNSNGDTPILIAILLGKLDILKIFAVSNLTLEDHDVAILYAVIGEFSEMIDFLLHLNYKSLNPLSIYIAYKLGNISVFEYLVKSKIKLEYQITPLHYASTYKNNFIIETVMELCRNNNSLPLSHLNISSEFRKWLGQTVLDLNARDISGLTPLMYAVRSNNKNVTEFLICSGADLNYRDKEGFTCIHHAVSNESLEALKILCLKEIDINLRTNSGVTPLHLSVRIGNLKVVQFLFDNKADLNCADDSGRTCMHYGTTKRSYLSFIRSIEMFMDQKDIDNLENILKFNIRIIELLIEKGSNPNEKDMEGATPLHYSVISGELETIKFLINKKADVKSVCNDGSTCLHLACFEGDKNIIEYFIEYEDVNVKNVFGRTPLHVAAHHGKLVAIETLINKGANLKSLDNKGCTCLHHASSGGDKETIEYFIEYEDVNVKNVFGQTPLHLAVQKGKLVAIKTLINKGANLKSTDNDGRTCLHYASTEGGKNTIEYFIKYEDVNVKDSFGQTPLDLAAQYGNLVAIETLINSGANLKYLDNEENTCLHHASYGGDKNIIEYFIEYEDVNVKNALGETPLHVAAQHGKLVAIETLINKGAKLNCLDNDKNTCLHLAAEKGFSDVIKLLIPYFDDVLIRNKFGKTPLNLAIKNEHSEVSNILFRAGFFTSEYSNK